jgi:hypothetical protein
VRIFGERGREVSAMDKKQLEDLNDELEKIECLLVLIATKSGAKSDEVGDVLGVGGSQIRNILSGVARGKITKRKGKQA